MWTGIRAVTILITEALRTKFLFKIAEKVQSIQAAGKSLRVTEWLCSPLYILCANHVGCGKAWVMLREGFRAGVCSCGGALSGYCGHDGSKWQ